MGTTVFPTGPSGESIHFDLRGPSDSPIRIWQSREGKWTSFSVKQIREKYDESVVKLILIEAVRFGQGTFERENEGDKDVIRYYSTSLPELSVKFGIDPQYTDDGTLTHENLYTMGVMEYNHSGIFNLQSTECPKLFGYFAKALSNRGQGTGISFSD